MTSLIVYVQQYGNYWNIPPKVFLALCTKVIKTRGGITWPRKYMLKGRPQTNVYRSRGEPEERAFTTRPNTVLYHPLDWDEGDYLQAYRDVAERMGIFQRRSPRTKLAGFDEYGFPIHKRNSSIGRRI